MKSNFTQKLMFLVLALGLGFLVACTGPEGPAGANGLDGSKPCQKCHSGSNADFNLKWNQYALSVHGTGTVYSEEAGNLACDGCHTGDGFAQACANNSNLTTTDGTEAINCKACHFIHTSYDSTDFKRRWTSAITFIQTATAGATQDFNGSGNLCAKCHQARAISRKQSADKLWDTLAKGSTTYNRIGPHYGIMSNMLTGVGIPPMAGVNYGTAADNKHMTLAKGCVSCHMATDTTNPAKGGHVFTMPETNYQNFSSAYFTANCANCHTKNDWKVATQTTTNKADIAKIRAKLISLSLLDTSQAITNVDGVIGYKVIGEYMAATPGKVKVVGSDTTTAVINYLFVAKDRSNGAHNPPMIKSMIAGLKSFFGIQ